MRTEKTSSAGIIDRLVVIGGGPVGSIFAAFLTRLRKSVFLVDVREEVVRAVRESGLAVEGIQGAFNVRLSGASASLAEARAFCPDIIAVAVKSFQLDALLDRLPEVYEPGKKILLLQNGVGNEERVADRFGRDSVVRAVINYAARLDVPGAVRLTFFNPPNAVGVLSPENEPLAREVAALLTAAGLETVFTTEIKKQEWVKTILSAGLMPVCAVTGLNMREAFEVPETRALCERILRESIQVVERLGYGLGPDFFEKCLGYLSRAGDHNPSSSVDLERGTPVEYVFQPLIVEGKKLGVPTPCLESLTLVIRALEKRRRPRV
ncbi:MAG: ketopantoate reductase family protein [Candidatus Aminicenantes bacterium]|nr:ketopantoate reductase family protein [Candidatus Aminicenantes bacterium]